VTPHLLDVSALIALIDSDHDAHERVHEWLRRHARYGWATCAITEIGFVRVISQPRYRNPISSADAAARLTAACESKPHQYWPCDVSLRTISTRLLGPSQVTDAYLLALCIAHDAKFATLDTAVALDAVVGATEDHLVVL
jgi:hypothetical protein